VGMANTSELRDHRIEIFLLSTRYKLNFKSLSTRQHEHALLPRETHTSPKSLSTRYKLNFRSLSTRQHEHALLPQETHTSPKSHHELSI
jgi:hypothetical protein